MTSLTALGRTISSRVFRRACMSRPVRPNAVSAALASSHIREVMRQRQQHQPFTAQTVFISSSRVLSDDDGKESGLEPAATADNTSHDTIHENVHLQLLQSKDPVPYSADIPLTPLNEGGELGHKKVTVVGCGQVGMGIAFAMLNQTTAGTIALVDRNKKKLEGEARDLEQGSAFHQNVRVLASDTYAVSQDSHLVIVTAGAAQKSGESRLNLVARNVDIMKSIIPNVLAFSPHAAICIVSNPCDVMTAVAAKIAGPSVPPGRIFGSGTCLDSSRLQSLLAKRLQVDGQSVSGYVIGEHGDTSVPVWSSVRVGGVPILKSGTTPSPVHDAMHKEVVDSAYDIIQRKGYTNWSVGLTGAHIGKAVLDDTRTIMPVSTCVRGMQGINEDVFLSMPCVMGSHGVRRVIDLPLTDWEIDRLHKSAETLWGIQQEVWDRI